MVVELYSFTNALQMWTSVEPNALGKSCPHTMSSKDGARKSAGATFPLRAADMNYIQAVDRIILEQVRSLVYRSAWITRTECPKAAAIPSSQPRWVDLSENFLSLSLYLGLWKPKLSGSLVGPYAF